MSQQSEASRRARSPHEHFETGLKCPKCKTDHECLGMSAISETGTGKAVRRRHVCQKCGERFRGDE